MKSFIVKSYDNWRIVITYTPLIKIEAEDLTYYIEDHEEKADCYRRGFVLEKFSKKDAMGNKHWDKIILPNDLFKSLVFEITRMNLISLRLETKIIYNG